eukprot:13440324-Alexandrium_andersonii.AAC.1
MLRPFEPDEGPDRGDIPRALRRRADVAYAGREPHFNPADRGNFRAAMVARVSRAPPATINRPIGLRV